MHRGTVGGMQPLSAIGTDVHVRRPLPQQTPCYTLQEEQIYTQSDKPGFTLLQSD
jgi:hypothetical protein